MQRGGIEQVVNHVLADQIEPDDVSIETARYFRRELRSLFATPAVVQMDENDFAVYDVSSLEDLLLCSTACAGVPLADERQ
jgi:hypothetical protein